MRAFIVGNGPSLRNTNLELLRDEVSYGVNAIHLLYEKTAWRPNHLVIGDLTQEHRDWVRQGGTDREDGRINRFLDIINTNTSAQIHIRGNYGVWAKPLLGPHNNVSYFDVCTHHSMGLDDTLEDKAPSEWHLPQICRWGGSVVMAIQLAALENYSPLYLLGCDLGYTPGTNNHFTPDYDKFIVPAKADALNAVIANAHSLANSQWEIYNAGVGGSLDAYERVNLEELF